MQYYDTHTFLFHLGADSLLVSHLLDPCHDEMRQT